MDDFTKELLVAGLILAGINSLFPQRDLRLVSSVRVEPVNVADREV